MKNYNRMEGKILSEEENLELLKQLRNGDNSVREKLIVDNLGLIYINISRINYNEKSEIFQYGAEGLIKAVDLFDINEGTPFNSYAAKCIEYRIYRGMRRSNVEKTQWKIFEYIEKEYKLNGKEPTQKEISEIFNISMDEVDYLLHADFKPCSLEDDLEKEDNSLAELILDQTNFEKEVLDKIYVEQLLDLLGERNRKIVKKYFGIGCIPMSATEIARESGITKSAVSLIITKSCKKMKKLSNEKISYFKRNNKML